MGINPIEYRPWKGQRTAQNARFYVIARSILNHKIRSVGVIVLLALGFFLVHVMQILTTVFSPHEGLEGDVMSSYMGDGILTVFAMLLAAVLTSDLISEDFANSSFVLYFSRAIKVRDYLIGKTGAALIVMGVLCAIPPVLVGIVSIATQTGDDYWHSAGILGRTVVAGTLVTVFFVPYGLMISSFTKRKSYAAVGTFMSFFALTLVSGIFSDFDPAWGVVSPVESLSYAIDWIFGFGLPTEIPGAGLAAFIAAFIVVPSVIVWMKIQRQVIGK